MVEIVQSSASFSFSFTQLLIAQLTAPTSSHDPSSADKVDCCGIDGASHIPIDFEVNSLGVGGVGVRRIECCGD